MDRFEMTYAVAQIDIILMYFTHNIQHVADEIPGNYRSNAEPFYRGVKKWKEFRASSVRQYVYSAIVVSLRLYCSDQAFNTAHGRHVLL
jgi:hypothetical protein